MPRKKDKIPPPGGKKDPYTNFMKKAKWMSVLRSSALDIAGRAIQKEGAVIVAHVLLKNQYVETLNLTQNHLGDAGVTEFAQMLKVNNFIRILKLGVNEITDVGGVMLASCFLVNRMVQEVYLQGNSLGDDTACAFAFVLRSNMEIKHLDLSWNAISSRGAGALAKTFQEKNHDLTFELGQNRIGDDGCKALCECLKGNIREELHAHFNLWQNNIGKAGGLALAEFLEKNNQLKSLNLSWNSIGSHGVEAMAKTMQVNVGYGEWRPPTEEEIAKFKAHWIEEGFKKVDEVKFQKGNEYRTIPPQVWQQDPLRPCCTITELNLCQNLVGDLACGELSTLIAQSAPLTHLNLSWNLITSDGAIALCQGLMTGTNLVSLNLSYNKITDSAAQALIDVILGNTTLGFLSFQRNELKDEGRTLISNAIPKGLKMRVNYGALDDMVPLMGSYGIAAPPPATSRSESRARSRGLSSLGVGGGDDGIPKSGRRSARKSMSRGSVGSNSTAADLFSATSKSSNPT